MNVPPVSVEGVQKCVVNFEIYRFLKKAANLPHPPLLRVFPSAINAASSILRWTFVKPIFTLVALVQSGKCPA